eukprot:2699882-Amphidinium_carterae.1
MSFWNTSAPKRLSSRQACAEVAQIRTQEQQWLHRRVPRVGSALDLKLRRWPAEFRVYVSFVSVEKLTRRDRKLALFENAGRLKRRESECDFLVWSLLLLLSSSTLDLQRTVA